MTSGYLNFLMVMGVANASKPSYAEGLDAGFPAIPFFSFSLYRRAWRQDAACHDALRVGQQISKFTVLAGASLALMVTSALGVLAGGVLSTYASEKHLHYLAGIGFIGIGVWTLVKA